MTAETVAKAHGLCYCRAPWRDSVRVPPRVMDRAHVPAETCYPYTPALRAPRAGSAPRGEAPRPRGAASSAVLSEAELVRGYGIGATEDDLLTAVCEALQFTGWRWQHIRRSDRAIVQGDPGMPDILAIRDQVGLALELKSDTGQPTYQQIAWMHAFRRLGFHALIIRPDDLDTLLEGLTGKDPHAFRTLADPEQ